MVNNRFFHLFVLLIFIIFPLKSICYFAIKNTNEAFNNIFLLILHSPSPRDQLYQQIFDAWQPAAQNLVTEVAKSFLLLSQSKQRFCDLFLEEWTLSLPISQVKSREFELN